MIQQNLKIDGKLKELIDSRPGEQFNIAGVVASRPENRENGRRILVKVKELSLFGHEENMPCKELLSIRIGGVSSKQFLSGDILNFNTRLKTPRNFGTPGEFDIERHYALKGIAASGYIKSDADIEITGTDNRSNFSRYFDRHAATIEDFIRKHQPGVEGGILRALLIGDCSSLPQELKDAYSRTGVNHVLSISGFHVGIIALALYHFWAVIFRSVPSLLLFVNLKRAACLVSMPAIIYYLFLSGAAPATARSVIMLLFVTVALLIERETEHLNVIAVAAFILLILNPAYLYDISFQLSFIAIWGLTVITPLISNYQSHKDLSVPGKLAIFAAASTAAVLVTLLPVAYYFQQVSITGIISNFLIIPLLGYGAVITGGLSIICLFVSPSAAVFLLGSAALLTNVANRIISYLDKIPTLPLFIPTSADIIILLSALMIISALKMRRSQLAIFALTPAFILSLHLYPSDSTDTSLKADFLSVGQGEATLITMPDKKRILIDGGGALTDNGLDVGRQLTLPALRKLGVKRVDLVILTHSHPDHLKGLMAVIENLEIGEFWESGYNSGKEYELLAKLLMQKNIRREIVSEHTAVRNFSGAHLKCLFPFTEKEMVSWPEDQNEHSLVLKIEYGATSLLFTGDIGFATELALVRKKADLNSAILKIPHHGSGYSSTPEFLRAVNPKIAVISAGYNNSFGLPARETIARLNNANILSLRTDLDGTVTINIPEGSTPSVITARMQTRRQSN